MQSIQSRLRGILALALLGTIAVPAHAFTVSSTTPLFFGPSPGSNSTINVGGSTSITSIRVIINEVFAAGGSVGTLALRLTAPNNATFMLIDQRGGDRDNIIAAVFTTSAQDPSAVAPSTLTSVNGANVTGLFLIDDANPQGLADLVGISSGGNWVLNLTDSASVGTGSFLGSWTIEFNEAAPVPLPAAAWLLVSGLAGIAAVRRRRRLVAGGDAAFSRDA